MSIAIKINARITMVHQYLKNCNEILLVLIFVAINLLISYIFAILSNLISNQKLTDGFRSFDSANEKMLIAILVGPFIETLIFQYAIIETARKKNSLLFSCILSALIFAIFHLYNVYYFSFAFFAGLWMAYLYSLKKSALKGFILTFLTHLLYNSCVFLLTR